MERNAANPLPIFHDSNFFTSGNSMKEKSKAILSGIRMGFAKNRIANSANTVAMA